MRGNVRGREGMRGDVRGREGREASCVSDTLIIGCPHCLRDSPKMYRYISSKLLAPYRFSASKYTGKYRHRVLH